MTNSGLTLATGTSNTIQIDGGQANTLDLPPVTGDGDLNLTTTVDGKLIGLGDMSGFSGDLSAAPSGEAAGMTIRISEASSMPNSTVTLSSATIANRAGGGDIAVISIGALAGNVGSTLDGFTGGSALPGTEYQIGALGTSTEFAGAIIDGESQSGGETTLVPTSLTKVGAGTLTLSNSSLNIYTGDTSVLDGTLSINNAYLDELADVYLATGAIFNLNFTDTNTIDSLFIDGVSQVVGTWGSPASAATNKSPLFSGMGILDVTFEEVIEILIGDYNDNGIVDAADFTVWRDLLGQTVALPNRDPDNMGAIGVADYDSWKGNFGATLPGAGSLGSQVGVPEPSSFVLTVLALMGLGRAGSRRRR
jgi:autotransporter-associated beta strand protein